MSAIETFLAMYQTRTAAAKAIGVSQSFISHVAAGRRQVSPEVAARIEAATGGKVKKESLIWPAAS